MTSSLPLASPRPDLFRCAFRARSYDVDGSQVVRPRVLMDFMEHARARVPEADPIFPALNRGLCRAFRLEAFAPIEGPLEVAAAVWVSRVGRTSYDISHELTAAAGGELLCRGRMTMVSMGPDHRPVAAPPTVPGRVRGEELTFPPGSEPGDPVGAPLFERAITITRSDENRGRHASHTRIVDHLDDTRHLAALSGALGGDAARLGGPARAVSIVYEGETHAGDDLLARVHRATDVDGGLDLTLRHRGDARLLARARILVR